MKRAVIGLLMAAIVVPVPAGADEPDPRFLTARDGVLVDGHGREVLLRGINHIGLRSDRNHPLDPHSPPADLFELQDLEDEDFDTVAALGFNSIRLVVTWEFIQPDPPPAPLSETYLTLIDDAIAKADARGMSVIFDFGQFGWSRSLGGNAGAPDWTVSDTCRSMPGPQPGAPPQASASVGCAYYNFWTDSNGIQTAYVDLWRQIAARYADEPAISMYDLQNEPVGGPLPPGVFEYQYLYPFYERLGAAIREHDTNHPIAFQPNITRSIGVPAPFVRPLNIDNAVYIPHSYSLAYTPQRVDPMHTQAHSALFDADLNIMDVEASGFGVPWLLGETGWTRSTHADGVGGPIETVDPTAPPAFARDLVRAGDRFRIGWHWFAYSSIDEAYGINHGDVIDDAVADELAQPFPRAMDHGNYRFIGGRYVQDIRDPVNPSEISVSMRWAPRGFCVIFLAPGGADGSAGVDADGALHGSSEITYAPEAALLTVPAAHLVIVDPYPSC